MKRFLLCLISLLICLFSSAYAEETIPDRSISVSAENTLLYAGTSVKLNAEIELLSEGAPQKTTLVWSSSDPSIASVNNTGTVKGIAEGSVQITASAKDNELISGNVTLQVVESVKSLSFEEKTAELLLGSTEDASMFQITSHILPENAYDPSLTWVSSNEEVATVDENGLVHAVSAGNATITATTNDASLKQPKKASCRVTVKQAVSQIMLSEQAVTINKGKSLRLNATVLPDTASSKKVTWESSDPSIASVSNGTISAKSTGTCLVSCIASDGSGITAACEVTVVQLVTGLNISINGSSRNMKELDLVEGQSQRITIDVIPSDATNKKIKWRSSNFMIAGIQSNDDGSLTVSGGIYGEAKILGTAEDGSGKSVELTVCVEPIVTLISAGTANWGTSHDSPWFTVNYKNTSKLRTVDGLTLSFYAEDVYGNQMKGYGYSEYFYEETMKVNIKPGRQAALPKITAYQFEGAKRIYYAPVKIHYTDGTTVNINYPYYRYMEYK